MLNKLPIKLNLGCGGRPLIDYVNIDMDTIDEMRDRYPNQVFDDSLTIEQYDIFNLPYEDASVDEVRADGLIEHLSFKEEKICTLCFWLISCARFESISYIPEIET